MTRNRKHLALLIGALAGFSLIAPPATQAATYYWDNNGTTAGFGTAALTWADPTIGDATMGWSTDGTGLTLPGTVSTLTTDSLNFGNGATGLDAGTITVSGTVNAGNLTFASGSDEIVLDMGTINLVAASTITVDNGTNTINSILSGAATSLTKAGTGNLTLTGMNTYSGGTIINSGQLTMDVEAHTALGTGPVTLNGGVLFLERINAANALIANGGKIYADNGFGDNWNGVVTLNTNLTVENPDYAKMAFNGNISGAGGLILNGPGPVNLTATNTYAGPTTVNGGTLKVTSSLYGNNVAQWTPANITVASGAALIVNVGGAGEFTTAQAGTLFANLSTVNNNGLKAGSAIGYDTTNAMAPVTISATIANSTGPGGGELGLRKYGTGSLQLTGANTYSGQTIIEAYYGEVGELLVSSFNSVATPAASSSLGRPTTVATGTIQIGRATYSGTTLVYTGAGETTDRVIDWGGYGELTFDHSGTGLLKFTSSLVIPVDGDGAIILQGSTAGIGELSGSIPHSENLGLIKFGSGTWKLSGANNYPGPTTISEGTLSVGTTANLGAPTANLVFDGGTLQITGTTLTNFSGIGHTVAFNLDQNVELDIADAANTFTVDQPLNQGTGWLYKYGPGTAILNQTNTMMPTGGDYSGVAQGTLLITKVAAMPGLADDLWFADPGATLAVRADNTPTNDEFTSANLDVLLGDNGNTWAFDTGSKLGIEVIGANTFTYANNIAGTSYAPAEGTSKGLVKMGSGTFILTGANTYTGGTTISAGTLQVGTGGTVGTGNVTNNASFDVATTGLTTANIGGTGNTTVTAASATLTANHIRQTGLAIGTTNTVTIPANGGNSGVSQVTNLTIGVGGKLDLTNNDLIVPTGSLTRAQVETLVNSGVLSATGILTTSASGITGLGTAQIGETIYAGSGSYGGLTVVNADTLVKYTYLGDADLSGTVDFDDYAFIDAGFFGGGNRWAQGDFDNNGAVDFDDYAFIDGSFFGQGAPLLTANISAVPEPSTWVLGGLAMLGLAGAGLRRRRLAV